MESRVPVEIGNRPLQEVAADRTRRTLTATLGWSFVAASTAGCAALTGGVPTVMRPSGEDPSFVPPPPDTKRSLALVLSGGSARGFAHLGMLRVLEREGFRPDLVVGTSAGAIVGALLASGLTVADMESAAGELDWSVLFDFDAVRLFTGGVRLGVVPGDRLEAFLRRQIAISIERFPVAFAAVAADMESGDVVALNHGDAPRAIRASSAVPGIYAPVRAGGRLLADGQVVSPLPVSTARSLGAVRVLALDVVYPPRHSEMSSPVSMLFQSLIVSGWRHVLAERKLADLVITPEIRSSAQLGLGSRDWLVQAGESAAQARLPEIRKLLAST